MKHSFVFSTLVFYLGLIYNFLLSLVDVGIKKKDKDNLELKRSLFPPNCIVETFQLQDIKPCSTEFGARLVPTKNEKGEIEWSFVEEGNSQLSHSQQLSKLDFNIPSAGFFDEHLSKIQATQQKQQFSPVSEASGSNESQIENLKLSKPENKVKVQLASPASSTLSPPSELKKEPAGQNSDLVDLSPQSSNKSMESSMEISEEDEDHEGSASGGRHRHACPYCPASFRLKGYLTRHLKKHSSAKLYNCPFFDLTSSHKCHSTGGFSRRDTYKTHLKSRHFKYPSGTKSANRTGMIGWCGLCGESFANNEIWVENHIESGLCPGLPSSYQKRDFTKKKTGKRSHLLDAVLPKTELLPPMELKKSPNLSTTSSPIYDSPVFQFKNKFESHSTTSSNNYQSPVFSPLSTQTTSHTPLSSNTPQLSNEVDSRMVNFDAFYYQPTQYKTLSQKETEMEDFAPLDDAFYQIKELGAQHVVNDFKSQFPDYGI